VTTARTTPTRAAQVVVLAKSPVPGRVKTRLTPDYTPVEAAGLAEAALVDTLRAARSASVRRVVLVLDGEPTDRLRAGVRVRPQRGGPLDERIAHALVDAWHEMRLPVLLVGMDTPQVTAAVLDRAVDRLLRDGTDAVLGPAADGGYWAIGVRHPRAEHVVSVPMSRSDTGARQLARLEACGLRVGLLETRRDVDLQADVDRVAAEAPGSAFAAQLARLRAGAA
jgi:rSAM/selenodomain-associated transferase 1